jgi:hypothetical protein
LEEIMASKSVQEMVEEAKAPGVFSILDAISDRAYPKIDVPVYLDEQTAYDAALLNEKLKDLEKKALSDSVSKQIEKIEEKIGLLQEKLEQSKYVFTIQGISEGQRQDALDECHEEYPIEYIDGTGLSIGKRVEKECPERDSMFTSKLWAIQIEKIVAPNGDVQNSISFEEVVQLKRALPLAAIGKINEALDKLRISTAMFMLSVDEDFLAKS